MKEAMLFDWREYNNDVIATNTTEGSKLTADNRAQYQSRYYENVTKKRHMEVEGRLNEMSNRKISAHG